MQGIIHSSISEEVYVVGTRVPVTGKEFQSLSGNNEEGTSMAHVVRESYGKEDCENAERSKRKVKWNTGS